MGRRPSARADVGAAELPGRKDILREFLRQVWSHGDLDAVGRFIANSYTIHNDPGNPWEGMTLDPDGFRDRVAKSRAVAPDQDFDPVEMIEDGDGIAVAWTWRGTHSGDLPGLPATGREIVMTGLTIYHFDDGDHITGHWQVADRLGVYRQIAGNAG